MADDSSTEGVVRDRDGKPVADANVRIIDHQHEWSNRSDSDGKFRIADVPSQGCMLLVEHPDFRFYGRELIDGNESKTCKLTRLGESVTESITNQAWHISDDERKKLLRQLFEPCLQQALQTDKDADKIRPLELLAKTDPARALEILDDQPFEQAQMRMIVRGRVIEQLAKIDPESAIEIAESMESGYGRAFSLMRISQRAPNLSQEERVAILARSAADAKSIKNPAQRVALLGLIADSLSDAGDRESAQALLQDTRPAAEKIANAAWAGFARGSFAEKLAVFDFEAALPMVTELADEESRIRHFGNMAHELARIAPERAEQLLNRIQRPASSRLVIHERDNYVVRVCYRMASVDLERAQRLADSCHEKNHQAYAHGVIAHALAKQDPVKAQQSLRRAYTLLEDGIRDPKVVKIHAAQIGGALLPTAEHIDPTLVREFIWRTVALRTPAASETQFTSWSNQQTAQLAVWLSPYDRELARAILESWHEGDESPYGRGQFTVAWTLVDPPQGIKFVETLEQKEGYERLRLIACQTLAAEDETRQRIAHREAGLWPIDAEDLDW